MLVELSPCIEESVMRVVLQRHGESGPVASQPHKLEVVGSNPTRGPNFHLPYSIWHGSASVVKTKSRNRCSTLKVRSGVRRSARCVTLPAVVIGVDLGLIEQTIGPVRRDQSGVCWSGVREILAPETQVFHG